MKDRIHDLKYFTSEYVTDPKGKNGFWTIKSNRAQYLIPTVKSILEKPLTDESIQLLGALALVFRVYNNEPEVLKWANVMYPVGNAMFLKNSLGVPLAEWPELVEQARVILLKMVNGDMSEETKNELDAYFLRLYKRKDQLMEHPVYGEFIRSRDGMGGG